MKYTAPKAELVALELDSVILLSIDFCIIDTSGSGTGGGDDTLPDFPLHNFYN